MTDSPTALAPRDLLILATLAEAPSHGYGLIKHVEARSESGVQLDPANLYRVLKRMRRLDWVSEQPPSATSRHGQQQDARRKIFGITETGSQVLEAELKRLERLLQQTRPVLASGRD